MLQVYLQLVAAAVTAFVAIHFGVSLYRRSKRDWVGILKGYHDGHGRLLDLPSATEGEDICAAKFEARPWAKRMLVFWTMYNNLEVILEAIDFVEKGSGHARSAFERIQEIRANATNAQVQIGAAVLGGVVPFVKSPNPFVAGRAIETYQSSISGFGTVLRDTYHDLQRSYRYFVTRQ